jgi:outer membrane protein
MILRQCRWLIPVAMAAWTAPGQALFAASQLQPDQRTEEPALTLEESIRFALRNNPQITAASSQVRQAEAFTRQRRSERLPSATLTGSINRQHPPGGSLATGGTGGTTAGSAGGSGVRTAADVTLFQPLFDAGLRGARERSARHLERAQGHFLAQTKEDLELQVARVFYDVLRGRQLVQVAQQRLTASQAHLRTAQALVNEGVAPSFDVIRTRAEVANAEQGLVEAQTDTSLAEANFNNVLGRDVRTAVRLVEPAALPEVVVSLDRAIEAAYQYRPQLKAVRFVARAAEADIRAARAGGAPELDFTADLGHHAPLTTDTGFSASYGVLFSYPLWDNRRNRFITQQAIELRVQREADAERVRQAIELEVRQTLLRVQAAFQRARAAQVEVEQATRSLEIANVRYNAGLASNVEQTDAQEALSRAGANLANARYDYLTAIRAVEHATGATWDQISAPSPAGGGR